MSKILEFLGAKNEEEAIETVKSLVTPPIVLTIVVTSTGRLNISCVGNNTSLSDAQDVLLAAVKQLAKEDALASYSNDEAKTHPA